MRHMTMNINGKLKRGIKTLMALLLSSLLAASVFALPLSASAEGTPISLGLAEHGIRAYNENWQYVYGGKNEGATDCAGLIYVYYKNIQGSATACAGGVSSQVSRNCILMGYDLDNIPRIPGLVVTVPDPSDPPAPYSHIGIYIGNGYVVDNSTYGVNMRMGKIADNSSWGEWHLFDCGTVYPSNGWYAYNGNMLHFTNYQYDVNTTVEYSGKTISIDSNGHADISVDSSMPNDGYASASIVAQYLTENNIGIGTRPDDGCDVTITGSGVRLRKEPHTDSEVVSTLAKGTRAIFSETVTGEDIDGVSEWWKIEFNTGESGYILSSYAQMDEPDGNTGNSSGNSSGEGNSSSDTNATVTGDGVGLRAQATTASERLTSLSSGTRVEHTESVNGESISDSSGGSSSKWYKVVLNGTTGYVCSLYVKLDSETSGEVATPSAHVNEGKLVFSCDTAGAGIYYTTDGSTPDERSRLYSGSFSVSRATYKIVAVMNGVKSEVYSFTLLSNGSIFFDIPADKWYFNTIDRAVSAGIVSGSDNMFSPDSAITRAEFVRIIANIAAADLPSYSSSDFTDVDSSAWYASAIAWAQEKGIVNGYDDGTFKPDSSITREEICVIFSNYSSLSSAENSVLFADDSNISTWAKSAVYACRDNGIISGHGENLFAPQDNATRAECAQIAMNYIDRR